MSEDPCCTGCGQIALINVVTDSNGLIWHRSCFGPPATEQITRKPPTVEELERTRDGLKARVGKAREAKSQS